MRHYEDDNIEDDELDTPLDEIFPTEEDIAELGASIDTE